MAERTFHQVTPFYEVPRDLPPLGLSFKSVVLDNPAYVTGSFDTYMDTSNDYATWLVESSTGPIIRDVLVSSSRVLGGIIHAQVASEVEWRAHVEAL